MEQLGIDPKLLLAQIVNFSIIIFLMTKILYKPILKSLEDRKKKIEEGLMMAEKMRKEEEKLAEKQEKLLEDARKKARLVIEEATKRGKEEEKKILADARVEVETLLKRGREEAARVRKDMDQQIRKDAVDLAVVMSRQLLTGVLSEKDQHTLLSKHIKELEKVRVH